MPSSPITVSDPELAIFHNPAAVGRRAWGGEENAVLDDEGFALARREITSWQGYAPTPLVSLGGLAAAVGLADIRYKDEGGRFGLGSFKALGGAYAVLRLLRRRVLAATGENPTTADLTTGRYDHVTSAITVTSATDGNHGRSVAWGAERFGCACVIFVHAGVSEGRKRAIERFGARVVTVEGNYDDSVRAAAAAAEQDGYLVVSDTSYEGYMEIPKEVMQGYSLLADEVLRQLPRGARPTHVFVQGGVGGLAAAVCAHLWRTYGADRPRFVVVEPRQAACLFETARAGRPTAVHGELDTIMAGLATGEVSPLAWDVLCGGADDFVVLSDASAEHTMRLLAEGVGGDAPVVAGESAVAGLAAALAALHDGDAARALDLGPRSRLLVIGSEGDTDPEVYSRIVGKTSREVREAREVDE